MANMDSVEFAAKGDGSGTKGVLADYRRGSPVKYSLPFHLVIPNPSSSTPTLRLNVAPKGFKPVAVKFACEALSTSAGVGCTMTIGDAGDVDRLATTIDCDTAQDIVKNVPVAGYDYEYTADTAIIATVSATTPIADRKIWGEIEGYLLK